MSIDLPGTRPTTLPWALLRTMYGPVNATYWSYFDGVLLSNLAAYSLGTGVVIGITSAWLTSGACGSESLNTIVKSSGVVMPEIGRIFPGADGAPTIELK